jgi:thioredoxin reductase
VAIGHHPNTELFKGVLDMDATGYLITKPDSTQTNIEGVLPVAMCKTPCGAKPLLLQVVVAWQP